MVEVEKITELINSVKELNKKLEDYKNLCLTIKQQVIILEKNFAIISKNLETLQTLLKR